jgi:hypothetical protein
MDPYQPPDELIFDNPYAPPRASFVPEVAATRGSTAIPCSIDSIVVAAWAIFHDRLGPCLWVTWGVFGINMGLSFLLAGVMSAVQAAAPGDQAALMGANIFVNTVSLLVQTWLGIGMSRGMLRIARGQPVSFEVLFSGGRYLLTTILAWLVVILLLLGAFLVPVALAGVFTTMLRDQPATVLLVFVVCSFALLGLLLYLSARLMQFYFLVIDRDAGVVDSIQRSWRYTRGHAGTIILVYLTEVAVFVAGLLACCVGWIFAIPFNNLLSVVVYLSLFGVEKRGAVAPARAERPTFTTWEDERSPSGS